MSKHLLIFLEIVHHSNSTALSEIRNYTKGNKTRLLKMTELTEFKIMGLNLRMCQVSFCLPRLLNIWAA